jgi:hypothetical protein
MRDIIAMYKPAVAPKHVAAENEIEMAPPNVRLNAFRLGIRLLLAAANPWSGMSREAAQKESWQPIDPYGWPRWWPAGAMDSVSSDQGRLMRRVLPKDPE